MASTHVEEKSYRSMVSEQSDEQIDRWAGDLFIDFAKRMGVGTAIAAFCAAAKGLTFDAANAEASGLVDRETGSHWDAYGACVSGPLKGSTLEALVLEPEYWFAWSEFHRSTAIYTPPAR